MTDRSKVVCEAVRGSVRSGRRSRSASRRWQLCGALMLLAAAGCAAADVGRDVQAFTGARIFDGTGAPVIEDGVLLVRDGRIVEVGSAESVEVPSGARTEDLEGRWIVPGFLNAHGHADGVGEGPSVAEQLEIYAHYGVSTVLSLGEESGDALGLREGRWSPGLEHSRLLAAGPIFTPASSEEARENVAELAELGVDWVKIRVDDFLGTATKMPPEAYRTVIEEAGAHGIPVAVHLVELEDAKGVVEAGADLVAHSVRDRSVDQELIDLMLERGVCLVPTLTRELSTFVYAERPDFFDDPFFLERAAPSDLDAFLTEELRASATSEGARFWQEALPVAEENLRVLHEAGVGIAMGTDTGTTFPGRFQGYFEHLELELMAEAGLAPEAVLRSATGEAARCLGLEGEVGTLQAGAWADLVVLDADPLEDIRNTREIHGVWIAGNRIR